LVLWFSLPSWSGETSPSPESSGSISSAASNPLRGWAAPPFGDNSLLTPRERRLPAVTGHELSSTQVATNLRRAPLRPLILASCFASTS
jgi:hypothetical protein